jgi:hypothetical protein
MRVVSFLSTRHNTLSSSLTVGPPIAIGPPIVVALKSSRGRHLVLVKSAGRTGPTSVYKKLLSYYFDVTIKRIIFKKIKINNSKI